MEKEKIIDTYRNKNKYSLQEYSEDLFESEFLKVMRNVHATIERFDLFFSHYEK